MISDIKNWKYTQEYCKKNNISYFGILLLHTITTNPRISSARKIEEINKHIYRDKTVFLNQNGLTIAQKERFNNTIVIYEKCKNELQMR